jgi:uncharacterized membrane protein
MDRHERRLERWLAAGLIDAVTADRIRAFEAALERRAGKSLPVALALGFGGLLVAAGILLFVAANWDQMSPALRTAAVLALVGAFHAGGAFAASRFEALATTLHAIGTIALGAGIFLAGQIFNLNEHWPTGVLLWAAGAWAGWWLLRDWPQLALAAILTPLWLNGEWAALRISDGWRVAAPEVGWFVLALAYLTVERERLPRASERTLFWLGALLLPGYAIGMAVEAAMRFDRPSAYTSSFQSWTMPVTNTQLAVAWIVAVAVPLAAAAVLRRRAVWLNAAGALWAVALVNVHVLHSRLWMYPWLAVGCLGLAIWGLRERRAALVNFAAAGFALTVMAFYFETVMTKMGRSASLIGLGVLFLVGGYLLERLRRRMVGNLKGGQV